LPALFSGSGREHKAFNSEREILYQVLFDMKKDMNDLKKLVHEIMNGQHAEIHKDDVLYPANIFAHNETRITPAVAGVDYKSDSSNIDTKKYNEIDDEESFQVAEEYHDVDSQTPLTLEDMERQMIKKTLEKHRGKRKAAADELEISERTLYRKIKEYGIE